MLFRSFTIYVRAYPNVPAENRNGDMNLIRRFLGGMRDREAAKLVASTKNPQQYTQALTDASDAEAGLAAHARDERKLAFRGQVNALTHRGQARGRSLPASAATAGLTRPSQASSAACYNCGGTGHRSRECPSPRATTTPTRGRGRGRATSRLGARTRWNPKDRSRVLMKFKRAVAALEEAGLESGSTAEGAADAKEAEGEAAMIAALEEGAAGLTHEYEETDNPEPNDDEADWGEYDEEI